MARTAPAPAPRSVGWRRPVRARRPAGALACAVALAVGVAAAGARAAPAGAPFPEGYSEHVLDGLRCSVVMPPGFDPARPRSMVVILHGAGGTETGMARSLEFLAKDEYVVLAPKSKGQVWEKADLDAVRRIVADVAKRVRVGEGRLHGAGFSNGGWNLAEVVFDPGLRFASACWIAAGFRGGKPPDHARKGMGVLALAGETDGNRDAAEATPRLLEGKVRSAEVRIEPGIGHEWPRGQMDYYGWWLGVQEGRFTPGVTLAFPWREDEAAARAAMAEARTGGFVYWYASSGIADERAKSFQNEVLQDPLVRLFGSRCVARKRDRDADAAAFAEAGLKETPAVVVLDAKGAVTKSLQGKITAPALAAALRSVARDRSVPKGMDR